MNIRRLVVTAGIVMDVVLYVDRLPEPGGDLLARAGMVTPGGGFNVMAAACRLGLRAAYAGRLGNDMFGRRARRALSRIGAELLAAPVPDGDTGFDVALVQPGGERTFVTLPGVEADPPAHDLSALGVTAEDAIFATGYELLPAASGAVMARLLSGAPSGSLVVFDPGPLAAEIPPENLRPVLERVDVLSVNRREARLLTGAEDPIDAARTLRDRVRTGTFVIVRDGAGGAWLHADSERMFHVPARPTSAIDTTGAGDVHAAAWIAAVARGGTPVQAVIEANAAASMAVERRGPAEGPTLEELRAALAIWQPNAGRV